MVAYKATQNELDALRRYELLFKATHDILYDLDLKNAHVLWNEALYSQYGYARDEGVGTLEWWVSRIHPEDALAVEGKFTTSFESDVDVTESTYRFQKADGAYAYVLDRGYLMRDDDGKPIRIIGSLLDTTEATKLSRAKDEFISLVSHQLRTPLTVIKFHSQMILEGMFGEFKAEQRTPIAKIADASTNLIKLVGEILNVSKIELERIRINPVLVEVMPLVQSAIDAVMPLAKTKGVTIDCRVAKDVPAVLIDPAIFEQILDNLLSNGIRYSRAQGGKITVAFEATENEYALKVKDNGIGIPLSDQSHIFERFYRANNARKVIEEGTGLGLYYIKVLAQAFDGDITFVSEEGRGTEFTLSIPLDGMRSSLT